MSRAAAVVRRSKRWETTIWKHSPARISSMAASTDASKRSGGVAETKSAIDSFAGTPVLATVGSVDLHRPAVMTSSRCRASS